MIKYMTSHTDLQTGRSSYRVMYDSGKHQRERVLSDGDDWPMTLVKFFTGDDTVRTQDRIIYDNDGRPAVRVEMFEYK